MGNSRKCYLKSHSLPWLLSEKAYWCTGQWWHVALCWIGTEKDLLMCMVLSGFFQVPGYRVAKLAISCMGDTWEATATIRLSHCDVVVLWGQNYPYKVISLPVTKIWWPIAILTPTFPHWRKYGSLSGMFMPCGRRKHCPKLINLVFSCPLSAGLEVARFMDSPER